MSVQIAVMGEGRIGLRHMAAIAASADAVLAGVIDRAAAARVGAAEGVPWFPDLAAMPDGLCDAAIPATPNHLHMAEARALVEAAVAA